MQITMKGKTSISINGNSYAGTNISVKNGKVIVDGEEMEPIEDKTINIIVEGDVQHLETTSGSVECMDAKVVKTVSGDVQVAGNVRGDVETVSGDVRVRNSVCGNVETVSGDVGRFPKMDIDKYTEM